MGPKKVKKTKKQIEEEKALAEAQRKLEEELERKRLEEEAEKKRIEDERRRIEEEKRKQEELLRLSEQAPTVAERDAGMIDKRKLAESGRKYGKTINKWLACDPLPDPEEEKELTTFITLWKEKQDPSLLVAVQNSQTAEDVVKYIMKMQSEALAEYQFGRIEWCNQYIKETREIIHQKYDEISAHILTYIENYQKYTEEELENLRNKPGNRQKIDSNQKPEFTLEEITPDL